MSDDLEYVQVKLVLTVKVGASNERKQLLLKMMRDIADNIRDDVLYRFNDETEIEMRYRRGFQDWQHERLSPARATKEERYD